MTKSDVANLLYIVKANYPKYYKNMSEQEFADMVNAWHICLSDYDYNTAQAGVKVYFVTDTNGFPPSVGQIIDCIHKVYDNDGGISELDAWGYVMKAISNSNYNSETEFQKLPEAVRNAVGSPARLREWAQLETDDVQTVIQSNFMRTFRAVQNRNKEYKKLPEDIKQIKQMVADQEARKEKEMLDNLRNAKLINEKKDVEDRVLSSPEFIEGILKQYGMAKA